METKNCAKCGKSMSKTNKYMMCYECHNGDKESYNNIRKYTRCATGINMPTYKDKGLNTYLMTRCLCGNMYNYLLANACGECTDNHLTKKIRVKKYIDDIIHAEEAAIFN
jgi:CRISPR/Cas system-associated protein Cas7 (RAMP superfamily)